MAFHRTFWHSDTYPVQLQDIMLVAARRIRNQIDNLLASDRALSLVVAIETALEDKRFEVHSPISCCALKPCDQHPLVTMRIKCAHLERGKWLCLQATAAGWRRHDVG